MAKRTKSTYEEFIERLTPKERQAFDEEYKDLLLSEMVLAAMEQDDLSVRELAKLAGVSPTIVQSMRSGAKKNFSLQSFFKILRSLDCRLLVERNGHLIALDLGDGE